MGKRSTHMITDAELRKSLIRDAEGSTRKAEYIEAEGEAFTGIVSVTTGPDMVNHPPHYKQVPGIECIEVTRWFNFARGNAIKYIWRAGGKGNEIEDLEKAVFYIQDEIKRLQLLQVKEAFGE